MPDLVQYIREIAAQPELAAVVSVHLLAGGEKTTSNKPIRIFVEFIDFGMHCLLLITSLKNGIVEFIFI